MKRDILIIGFGIAVILIMSFMNKSEAPAPVGAPDTRLQALSEKIANGELLTYEEYLNFIALTQAEAKRRGGINIKNSRIIEQEKGEIIKNLAEELKK